MRSGAMTAWAAGLFALSLTLFGVGSIDPMAQRWLAVAVMVLPALFYAGHLRMTRTNILAFGLLAWMALSLLWSSDPAFGVVRLRDFALLFVVFLTVQHCTRFDVWLPRMVAASIVAVCFVSVTMDRLLWGGFGNEMWLAEFLVIAAPLCFVAKRIEPWACIAALLAIVTVFFHTDSNVGWFAVLCLVGLAMGYALYRGWWYALAFTFFAGLAAFLAFDAAELVKYSVFARFEVFWNSLQIWATSPLAGHGLGSFAYEYPLYREAHIGLLPDWWPGILYGLMSSAGEPHNEAIYLLAETGVVGLLIGLAILASLFRQMNMALFFGIALSMIGFPLHNPATGVLIAVAAGLASRTEVTLWLSPGWRLPLGGVAMLAGLAMVWNTALHYVASSSYSYTQIQLNGGGDYDGAFLANWDAYQTFPQERAYRLQLALTLDALYRNKPSIDLEPKAADQIYAISRSAGEHHPGLKAVRARYLISKGRVDEAEPLLADLSNTPTGQLLDAWAGVTTGDGKRIAQAVARGMETPGIEAWQVREFDRVAAYLKTE